MKIPSALPFWMSLALIPLAVWAMWQGGWWWVTLPVYSWYLVTGLDLLLGRNRDNPIPDAPDSALFWHRAVTAIWAPLQIAVIFSAIWAAGRGQLSGGELAGLFFGIGVLSGTIGMVYAHELLHQKPA
ncbi:MAG: alkane 1-monooxygenase, partial [Paracoccus sp. (in: a-proteobacteria)]|nr:alkane 1-monooxygenase [Paracoccus sp. (in: a-proteobacteria)]